VRCWATSLPNYRTYVKIPEDSRATGRAEFAEGLFFTIGVYALSLLFGDLRFWFFTSALAFATRWKRAVAPD